jgi:hypothetical protein
MSSGDRFGVAAGSQKVYFLTIQWTAASSTRARSTPVAARGHCQYERRALRDDNSSTTAGENFPYCFERRLGRRTARLWAGASARPRRDHPTTTGALREGASAREPRSLTYNCSVRARSVDAIEQVRPLDTPTNFYKTELELGDCLRLPQEGPCECDLCLSCLKFLTTTKYAPRLRERLCVEQQLSADAPARGWAREVERTSAPPNGFMRSWANSES